GPAAGPGGARGPGAPRGRGGRGAPGPGLDGLGGRVDEALRTTGFDTTRAPGNGAGRDVKRTVISYDPRWDRSARTVSTALPGSELRAVTGQGRTVLVIAGADYKKVVPVRPENPYQGEVGVVTGDQVVCGG
ncbi:LytR C-terminal domain-containing protein, partial [Streptomyces goshikiensis]|uniref:LytR C-terminal domain-containing protein n=1 Tax=Streptomyces goshikiensis TaxID=1942 RepID=UPI0036770EB8